MPAAESDADVWGAAPGAPPVAPVGDDGSFAIYPDQTGGYADQSGSTYTIDPASGRYVDKAGKQYEPSGPIAQTHVTVAPTAAPATPKGVESDADIWGTQATPAIADRATPESVIGQGEQGALNSLTGTLGQVQGAGPDMGGSLLGMGVTAASDIGDVLRSAFTGEPMGGRTQVSVDQPTAPQFFGAPQNLPERIGRTLGTYAPGAAIPAEGALAGLTTRAANTLLPAAGSLAGSETSRAMGGTQEQQDTAGNVGGLVGGLGAAGATMGPKALQGLTDPFMAAISPAAAERVATSKLLASSSNPDALRGMLAAIPPMLPASLRTTGQLTGDLGVLSAEKAASVTNPVPFRALAGQQASANDAALGSVASTGAPMQFRDHVAASLEAQDQALDGAVQAARGTAQTAAGAIGGTSSPEALGSAARDPMQAALDAGKARNSALYDAVDPDGTLTGNVQGVKAAAADIRGRIAPIQSAQMTGAEKTIFDDVANLKDVTPLRTVMALKAQVNDAIGDATASGNNVVAGRLKALREALNDNLATSISDPVGAPGAGARYQAWDSGNQPNSAAVDRGATEPAPPGSAEVSGGASGASLSGSGGPGGSPGTSGVSGEISPSLTPIVMDKQVVGYTTPDGQNLSPPQARTWQPPTSGSPPASTGAQPTVDADAIARQKTADASYAAHAQTFQSNPVAPTLKTNGYAGQYNVADSSLPARVFPSGPGGAQAVDAFVKAGAPPGVVSDMAAATLRKAAMNADGTIDPTKFATWQKTYGDAIRALPPGVAARFTDAASASQAVADAEVNRAATMKAAQAGAIGKIVGADNPDAVVARVGQVFQTPATAVSEMGRLADATANNPDARAGLQRAVVQYMQKALTGNNEVAGSGVNGLKSDQFQTFVKNNRAALAKVFTPAQLDTFQAVADNLHQANRSVTAVNMPGQSASAQLFHATGMPGGAVGTAVTHSLFDGIAATLGGALGPAGPAIGVVGSEMLQALRSRGVANINDLFTQALLKPEVAKAMLAKVNGPIVPQSPVGMRLLRALSSPSQQTTAKPAQRAVPGLTYPSALRGVSP